jgi:S1-C subfamily serine protease
MSKLSENLSPLLAQSQALVDLVAISLPRTASIWVKAQDMVANGSGSGWCLDSNHIVTNHHVVKDSIDYVRVRLPGQSEKIGRVVGSDAITDLAVIEVDDAGVEPFVIREAPLQRGELSMTLGSPLGEFTDSVSLGIISGLNRQIDMGTHKFEEAIQTDATINPGNSGGPLIDMTGQLIGVNFCSRRDAAQLNFAIPTEVVTDIVPELISHGAIMRASLGIAISAVPVTADGEHRSAVEVQRTNDDSPLKKGDVILAINGAKIQRRYDLMRQLNRSAVGTVVNLSIARGADILDVTALASQRQ